MSGFPPEYADHDRGLIAGLRDHGYIEGKNLTLHRRYGQLEVKRIYSLAQELAKMELDAIFTVCTTSTRAVLSATSRTPIVMLSVSDPVGHGLAASLARSGINVTGRSNLSRELLPKLMQVFHDAVPQADRIAVLLNSLNPLHAPLWAEALIAARPLNVELVRIDGRLPAGFEAAMQAVLAAKANALLVLPDDAPTLHLRPQIAAFASKHMLPLVGAYGAVSESEALLTYGENPETTAREAATYVNKLVHGARPAELPIEEPKRFVLAVNLRVAKKLGVTIPPQVFLRADQVFE
jgi:putative ABC transport system substrate-binding protein